MTRIVDAAIRGLASRWYLGAVLALAGLQAAWLAVISRPSQYDENFHLLLIRAFSDDWVPFVEQMPEDGAVGDIERFGSYLYPYLLSFVWRATGAWGGATQVLVMRLISVVLVVAGLYVWGRVFRALGASPAAANVAVTVVAASPLLIFVAGSVNYDNLLFLMVPLTCLVAVRVYRAERLDPGGWLLLVAAVGFTSVTKYSALPLLATLGVGVLVRQVLVARRDPDRWELLRRWWPSTGWGRTRAVGLVVLAVIGVVLFVERYGVNLAVYGAVVPNCIEVQDFETCHQWGPWARNYAHSAEYPDQPITIKSTLTYLIRLWVPLMLHNLTVIGVVGPDGTVIATVGPNVLGTVTVLLMVSLTVALLLVLPRLRRHRGALLLLAGAAAYVGSLFFANLGTYHRLGIPAAVQGRYLLVVLPVVVGAIAVALPRMLGEARGWKVAIVVVLLVGATQGGGFLQYHHETDSRWWVERPGAAQVQEWFQEVARVVVVSDEVASDYRPRW